jgi:hypothetical protein
MNAQQIIDKNSAVLREMFRGIASCDYYDGSSYALVLDGDTLSIRRNHTFSADDTSRTILEVCGYTDMPEDERYKDGDDLKDYLYSEWLDSVMEELDRAAHG